MEAKFREIQKFKQWWLWLLLFSLLLLPIYTFVFKGSSAGFQSLPVVLVILLFWMLKLKTRIDLNGVNMVYFPFVSKFVEWGEIKKVSVIDYGFVGGWGIRFWTKYGTVYNVSGSKGLFIELESGKTFIIGSQNEKELKTVLKELGKLHE